MSQERVYTPEMGEISGFGNGYEDACRKMVLAGLKYLDEHPDADPKFHGFEGVFGLAMEDNDDAKALSEAMLAAVRDEDGGGATGAMHHATVQHVMVIRKNGWDWYVAEMSKRDDA